MVEAAQKLEVQQHGKRLPHTKGAAKVESSSTIALASPCGGSCKLHV
jgi:hypothetical protein